MRREEGALMGEMVFRDPKTGEEMPAEERLHAGASLVTWVQFPEGWRIISASALEKP